MAVTRQLGQLFPGHHSSCQKCWKCPKRKYPPLIFSAAWEATDVMQILPSTSMLRCGAVREEEPCPGYSSCLPSQGRRPAGVEGCGWSWGFAAPNGKVPGSREPGQSCRTWVDSAIVIKACELTCGQLYRELSMLQLNELVEDSGKTKIKTGQVQAVSRGREAEFQSTLSAREEKQEKKPSCVCRGHFQSSNTLIITDLKRNCATP